MTGSSNDKRKKFHDDILLQFCVIVKGMIRCALLHMGRDCGQCCGCG
jgi:hypothetical protein